MKQVERLLYQRMRHLVCKPTHIALPKLEPSSRLSLAFISGFSYEPVIDGYHYVNAVKALRLSRALEVLEWFNLQEGRDLLAFPSSQYMYRNCDPMRNTVLSYIIPKIRLPNPPVKILVPENVYITSFDQLIASIQKITRGKVAKVYVVSKYGMLGTVYRFLKELMAKHVELYLASISSIAKKIEQRDSVKIVPTKSHRKLILIVLEPEDGETPIMIGYRGSMNIFVPGIDDYLEAVNEWEELKRVLHGLMRAFLIY